THTHQSSMSVVVRRLVKRGLVTRRPAEQDARRIEIELSAAGRALLRRLPPTVQLRLIRAMARLSRVQRQRLASLLRTLVKEMGLAGSPALMIFAETESQNGSHRRGYHRGVRRDP
ncbi:MAG: MarR family winged helix-turn-helix transcriptional regulator, partial [Gemmatimonadales bacterium]